MKNKNFKDLVEDYFKLGLISFISQKNRHLFTQLELLRKDSAELHSRWTRLLLERSTLGSNVRIENVARNKLQLKPARPQDTVIIE